MFKKKKKDRGGAIWELHPDGEEQGWVPATLGRGRMMFLAGKKGKKRLTFNYSERGIPTLDREGWRGRAGEKGKALTKGDSISTHLGGNFSLLKKGGKKGLTLQEGKRDKGKCI